MPFKRENWCICFDLSMGSAVSGLYTFFLSLVFIGLSGRNLEKLNPPINAKAEKYKGTVIGVYAMVILFCIALAASSVILFFAIGKRLKWLFLPWLISLPLWSIFNLLDLIVIPEGVVDVHESNPVVRIFCFLLMLFLHVYEGVCVLFCFLDVWHHPEKEETGPVGGMVRSVNDRIRSSLRRTNSWTRNQIQRISMRKPKDWAKNLDRPSNEPPNGRMQNATPHGANGTVPVDRHGYPHHDDNRPVGNFGQRSYANAGYDSSRELVMNPSALSATYQPERGAGPSNLPPGARQLQQLPRPNTTEPAVLNVSQSTAYPRSTPSPRQQQQQQQPYQPPQLKQSTKPPADQSAQKYYYQPSRDFKPKSPTPAADSSADEPPPYASLGGKSIPLGRSPGGDRQSPRGDAQTPRGDRYSPRGDAQTPRGDRHSPRGGNFRGVTSADVGISGLTPRAEGQGASNYEPSTLQIRGVSNTGYSESFI